MIHLNYRDARPIYTQIADGVREQILSGVLQAGDRLPSVREMAAELTINPNTIQRSYRELELQGWIATVPGKGCFVCGVPLDVPNEKEEWMRSFDKASRELMKRGVTVQELVARLMQGGMENA